MSFTPIRLIVYGDPAPQGSKVPFVRRGRGGVVLGASMKEDSAPDSSWGRWRPRVHDEGKKVSHCACPDPDCQALVPGFPINEPVTATMAFYFSRPAGHFYPASPTKGRAAGTVLRPDAPVVPMGRVGDTEKLARAVADALQSALVLADDKLIARYHRLERLYCGPHEQLQQAGAVIWLLPYEVERVDPRYAPPVIDVELPALF